MRPFPTAPLRTVLARCPCTRLSSDSFRPWRVNARARMIPRTVLASRISRTSWFLVDRVTCLTSPGRRLFRPLTPIQAPWPCASRRVGHPVVRLDQMSERAVGPPLIPFPDLMGRWSPRRRNLDHLSQSRFEVTSVTGTFPMGAQILPWGLDFGQSSSGRSARVLRRPLRCASGASPLSRHAMVPFPFQV
jgi:hypothetical protein